MTNTTLTAIASTTSLDELCAILNDLGDAIASTQSSGEDAADLIHAYSLAVESAPTFGGDEPHDTNGIWSWDESRLLVGGGWGGLQVIDRDTEE
jgi:hypothetical protein